LYITAVEARKRISSPIAADTPALATVMPGHYPIELAMDAGFSESVSAGPLPGSIAVLAILTALATVAFYRETSP